MAILIDAFVVRCLIVPGRHGALGERAWWMPGWLERRVAASSADRDERHGVPLNNGRSAA